MVVSLANHRYEDVKYLCDGGNLRWQHFLISLSLSNRRWVQLSRIPCSMWQTQGRRHICHMWQRRCDCHMANGHRIQRGSTVCACLSHFCSQQEAKGQCQSSWPGSVHSTSSVSVRHLLSFYLTYLSTYLLIHRLIDLLNFINPLILSVHHCNIESKFIFTTSGFSKRSQIITTISELDSDSLTVAKIATKNYHYRQNSLEKLCSLGLM